MSSPRPAHDIVLVSSTAADSELLKQCRDVRIKVFVDEQKFPAETEIDEYDEGDLSVHYLVQILPLKEPAGVVRIVPSKMKIGRLCILPEYRKYRFGSDLMVKAHDYLRSCMIEYELKEASISLHAQIPVVPFYARLGYAQVGEHFDEDGAPHQRMVLVLQPAVPTPHIG
ncbi:hypothetical protein FRB94_000147 [Tulasnella sp. JGI-2019a]|nr:hypothetical protein FRB94_000147 [Tulasnella sp. JGI-2019a]